jgi:negative regulator of sigma-B (phosphoserine phosphatase)
MMDASGISWGVAEKPLQVESGDRYVVAPYADGVLVGVVDGMGHGAPAAEAALRATTLLTAFARESPISLINRCHQDLRGTRGVVMTLVAFDLRDRTLTWIGVGNVDAVLIHANGGGAQRCERAVLRGGVIGYQLPALKAEVLPLQRSDTVILTTDGVEPEYSDDLTLHGTPQAVADEIMAGHGRATDDALVLVARFQGAHRS